MQAGIIFLPKGKKKMMRQDRRRDGVGGFEPCVSEVHQWSSFGAFFGSSFFVCGTPHSIRLPFIIYSVGNLQGIMYSSCLYFLFFFMDGMLFAKRLLVIALTSRFIALRVCHVALSEHFFRMPVEISIYSIKGDLR